MHWCKQVHDMALETLVGLAKQCNLIFLSGSLNSACGWIKKMENLKLEETVQALMVLFWTTGRTFIQK